VPRRRLYSPEHGGSYTVKMWESDKTVDEDGWRHREIRLAPDSDNVTFEPIIVRSADESVQVIAEMLEVLPGPHRLSRSPGERSACGQRAVSVRSACGQRTPISLLNSKRFP
jgi:hypothetical protein